MAFKTKGRPRQPQRVARPQARPVVRREESEDDPVAGCDGGDHHEVDEAPAGAPVRGAGEPPAGAVGRRAQHRRTGAAQVSERDAGPGPSRGEAGVIARPGGPRRAEQTAGRGLGPLVLGVHEPGGSARAAEQLDRLALDPGVGAEPALVRGDRDRVEPRVGQLREVRGIDPAGRVVGGRGVRRENLAGEPGGGLHRGMLHDVRRRGEERLDGRGRTRVHEATLEDRPGGPVVIYQTGVR